MLFAEAATVHPDKTFSVLKAGIDRLIITPSNPGQQNMMMGALIVRIRALPIDAGLHELGIILLSEKNEEFGDLKIPRMAFEVPPEGRVQNSVVNIAGMQIPPVGRYSFKALIDGIEAAQWPLEVLTQ